ncbi:MAG: aminopeptidase P N-terminal domain-containing protein [Fimbriimonas sp.]
MIRLLRVPLVMFALLTVANSQQPYPVFEKDKVPTSELRERRSRLLGQLDPTGAAVVFTNPEHQRSNDTDFRFRPNSDFWYLTGCEEPDSALLLVPSGITVDGARVTEVLFVNDRNPGIETWTGYRMGPEGAAKLLSIDKVVSNTRFAEVLKLVAGKPLHDASIPVGATGGLAGMIAAYQSLPATAKKRRTSSLVGRMRVTKSPFEIKLLRKAMDASGVAHIEAMRSCEPGMREWEIGALVEYLFARQGCEATAYGSIVGCGPNSCILHYMSNRGPMVAGKIVCMDVGGEYHGYAADITRSYPVNGKFSPEQKAIYELVLKAQLAGIDQCQPGKPFNAPHQAAVKVIQDGLVALGIIKNPNEVGRYFMHGTSHYVGLDVHDPQEDPILNPNCVLTVEPGIYINSGSPCDPKWWDIGIRIEDCVLITTNGHEVISAMAPKTVPAIEALMKEKGLGNMPAKPYLIPKD